MPLVTFNQLPLDTLAFRFELLFANSQMGRRGFPRGDPLPQVGQVRFALPQFLGDPCRLGFGLVAGRLNLV